MLLTKVQNQTYAYGYIHRRNKEMKSTTDEVVAEEETTEDEVVAEEETTEIECRRRHECSFKHSLKERTFRGIPIQGKNNFEAAINSKVAKIKEEIEDRIRASTC